MYQVDDTYVTDHYVRKDYYVRGTITSAKCGTIMSAGPLRPQSVGRLYPRDDYVRKVRDDYVRGTITSAKCGTIMSAGRFCP